jgi:hypothetical protein
MGPKFDVHRFLMTFAPRRYEVSSLPAGVGGDAFEMEFN